MAGMKLVFLDRPGRTGKTEKFVTLVADRLVGEAEGRHPADFAAVQVVLPTAEAGRIIREELAQRCDDRGGAVNLSITMPEHLLQTGVCASNAAVLAAWLNVLRDDADNRDFPTLLRNGVLDKFRNSTETLLGWAESFQHCRRELALEDLDLAEAVARLNELCKSDAAETTQELYDRFDEFRRLEELYLARLGKSCPLPDPAAALKRAIESPELLPGVKKIVLIDCLDLKNGPAHYLERAAAKGTDVEFWLVAPEDCRDRFDRFGRPFPDLAEKLSVRFDLERQLRCVPRPDQQARKLLELVKGCGALPAAVAVPDPEVAEALELRADLEAGNAPDRNGVPRFFVPREFPLDRMPWTRIFLALAALAADKSVAAAARLWEEPFFADYAEKTLEVEDFPGALTLLDRLRGENFAADTDFLEELARRRRLRGYDVSASRSLEKLCRAAADMRRKLAAGGLAAAFEITGEIGAAKHLGMLELRRHENEIAMLAKLVSEVVALNGIGAADVLPLFRRLAAGRSVSLREKPWEDAVDAVGFLEIGYSRDDVVLMAGFNEEVLSNGAAVDPLLPEKLREALGMTTRARRFAADALRFSALAASRDLYILYGKKSQSGETLRPSRLLFLCGADELPHRVGALFGDTPLIEEPRETAVRRRKFEVPPCAPDGFAMSITGFKAYLECPFTFALQKILRTESCDPEAVEMDDLRYGTFFHSVLETLMRNYIRMSAEEVRKIGAEQLEADAKRALRECESDYFGGENRLPGLARLQCGIIADALKYVAGVQSAAFADSWRVLRLEQKVDVDWGELFGRIFPGEERQPWRDGIRLKGKIDRIDLREGEDGAPVLRVLDYKTSAHAESPFNTHTVTKVPEGEEDFRLIPGISDKKKYYWKDLQLPLYVLLTRHALIGEMGPEVDRVAAIGAGYFNLPPELTRIGIDMFDALERPGVPESAARCADGILRRIYVEKLFWPPKTKRYGLFENCELDIRDFAAGGTEVR